MSTQLDNDANFHNDLYQQKLPQHYRSVLTAFHECSRPCIRLHLLFSLITLLEIIGFSFCSAWLPNSASIALIIGGFFLTLFSYLTLLFYFQAKKPEQMNDLLRRFIASCRSSLGLPEGVAIHHLSVAETLVKLAHYLTDHEWKVLRVPDFFFRLTRMISLFSASSLWQDVFRFKQQLLHAAIQEHLHQIRITPTDLEVHASLANAYVALSQIYQEPKTDSHPGARFYKKHAAHFLEKFQASAALAMEEFQILNYYAPNDPWIHEQLAAGYKELGLPNEEIKEVEILLKLRPNDRDILLRLGILYFQQDLNAKGLQVYEELKKANFKKAEELVSAYGSNTLNL